MTLEATTTHEYFMKDASLHYNEEHAHLVIFDDDMNSLDIGGIKLEKLKALFADIGSTKLRQIKKAKEAA